MIRTFWVGQFPTREPFYICWHGYFTFPRITRHIWMGLLPTGEALNVRVQKREHRCTRRSHPDQTGPDQPLPPPRSDDPHLPEERHVVHQGLLQMICKQFVGVRVESEMYRMYTARSWSIKNNLITFSMSNNYRTIFAILIMKFVFESLNLFVFICF